MLCLRTLSRLLRFEWLVGHDARAAVEPLRLAGVVAVERGAVLRVADLVDHGRRLLRLVQGLHAGRHHFHRVRTQVVADLVPCGEVLLHHDAIVLDRARDVALLPQAAIRVRVLGYQAAAQMALSTVSLALRGVLVLLVLMMHMKVVMVG